MNTRNTQFDAEFLARLRAAFRVEAAEHLQTISTGLLDLEKQPAAGEAAPLIETSFRAAHSLKGAARAVNLTGIEAVCQALESVFAALKRQTLELTEDLFELLYETVDVLSQMLAADVAGEPVENTPASAALIQRLEQAAHGNLVEADASKTLPRQASSSAADASSPAASTEAVLLTSETLAERAETIRITKARLDALLLQAEELLAVKLATGQFAAELRELRGLTIEWERQWAKAQPEARRTRQRLRKRAGLVLSLDDAARLVDFLDWNQEFVRALYFRIAALAAAATREHRVTAGMVDNLIADVRQAVLFPFGTLLESFPKVARDLARSQGKSVELVIAGTELEIDRRVLEEIKDPLLHLVRNSIDHGLETPAVRLRQGKPERGTITITAAQQGGNQLVVTITDDGAGIDPQRVVRAAIKAGLLTPDSTEAAADIAATLKAPELFDLLSQSGFSTSPLVTEISGRGLGLAILRERVERLGGAVEMETRPQEGTTFRLVLPLTLTTFRGVLLKCSGQTFVLPTTAIERVLRIKKSAIQYIEGVSTYRLADRTLPLAHLSDLLELTATAPQATRSYVQALILQAAGAQLGLLVDEIVSEQEVIVKNLGTQLARVRNIAGATVLATGPMALILNAADLVKSVHKHAHPIARSEVARRPQPARLLVAEDSVTTRALLRGILENAGYEVKTAVDGLEAWVLLKREPFALLVSDVEMPRMNGIELTTKLRQDDELKDLPVILITALASDEDRRRGVEAGANAYVVKSSFEQSNLLAAIGRLI